MEPLDEAEADKNHRRAKAIVSFPHTYMSKSTLFINHSQRSLIMAQSTCPHCENKTFELSERTPTHSTLKVNFVQCSKCGAPIGALSFFDAGVLMKKQEKEINTIKDQLSQIEYALNQLNSKL
jgi:hypothetical protein